MTVSLVDLASGETIYATTNGNGVYQFNDVPVGQSYIVTVEAIGYAFSPSTRFLSLTEELNDVDFTAIPNKRRGRL